MPAVVTLAIVVLLANSSRAQAPKELAETYAKAVQALNEAHAKKPAGETEAALSKKMPREAVAALETLLKAEGDGVGGALVVAGEAALDLDRIDDFEKVRTRIAKVSPDAAAKLGIALSRPRFVMRGLDGVEKEGLEAVAAAADEVLDAYAATFAFAEWSKVPGKKLRFRVHLVTKIEKPPHFAPEFPFHSEIDFPVIDKKTFTSPTEDGQFLLYGLAHELGHVIAMWGDADHEEDFHAWAHYTGLVVVTWLATNRKESAALKELKDVKWRSVDIERYRLSGAQARPGRTTKDAVLELLFETQDMAGTKAIGEAINALDKKDERLRVNGVRYYTFDAFGKALKAAPSAKKKAKDLALLFPN